MKYIKLIILSMLTLLALGCASTKPQMSTLEVRSMQTKEYQSTNELEVYKALINALLDREFILKASDSDAGVVLASYTTTKLNKGEVLTKALATYLTFGLNWIFGDNNLDDSLVVDVSGNVTQREGITKVRINAVAKRLNSEGEILETQMIVEPAYYNSIFEQIEKSVFLEQNYE